LKKAVEVNAQHSLLNSRTHSLNWTAKTLRLMALCIVTSALRVYGTTPPWASG